MELAREDAETIERRAYIDLFDAASDTVSGELGMHVERLGDAIVASARTEPGILLNRCFGLGVAGPARREQVAAVAEHFRARNIPQYYVHVVPESRPAALREWLREAGMVPHQRSWMKFLRGATAPPVPRSDLRVTAVRPPEAESFGMIIAESFGLSDRAVALLTQIVGRPRWYTYVTVDPEGKLAGAGAMFVDDGVAWLSFAATLKDQRGRGAQAAVLARRIRDALDLGVRLLVTETGTALEGEPQHSYRNIERAGFEATYVRQNWISEDWASNLRTSRAR